MYMPFFRFDYLKTACQKFSWQATWCAPPLSLSKIQNLGVYGISENLQEQDKSPPRIKNDRTGVGAKREGGVCVGSRLSTAEGGKMQHISRQSEPTQNLIAVLIKLGTVLTGGLKIAS